MPHEKDDSDRLTPSSQFALAYQYEFGKCVPLDADKAVYWYRKAAEQTESSESASGRGEFDKVLAARCKLAELYEKGQLVAQDYRQAYDWYTKAIEVKHPSTNALWRLGRMHRKGYGVPKDFQLAREWLHKAATYTSAYWEAMAELRKIAKTEVLHAEQFSSRESVFSSLPNWNPQLGTLSQRKFSAQLHAEVTLINRKLPNIGRLCVMAIGIDRFNQFEEQFGSGEAVALEVEVENMLRKHATRLVRMGDGKFFALCIETDFGSSLARASSMFGGLMDSDSDAEVSRAVMRKHVGDRAPFALSLAIGLANTNLTNANAAGELVHLALQRLQIAQEPNRNAAQNANENRVCPRERPLDEYLAEVAELPLPTDEQIERFCGYVMANHSWYKGSILQGQQFMFFLNAELGPGTTGKVLLNDIGIPRSAEYRERYGYLDYRFGRERTWRSSHSIPLEVQDIGGACLYPYMSNLSKAKDLIWHRNPGVAEAIGETQHPDRELIKLLRARHEAKLEMSFRAFEANDSKKFMAFVLWQRHGKMERPSGNDFQGRKAEDESQLSEEDMRAMHPWYLQMEQAEVEEKEVYDLLNAREKSKIREAIRSLVGWLRNQRE